MATCQELGSLPNDVRKARVFMLTGEAARVRSLLPILIWHQLAVLKHATACA
jgi:hypothetical protein